MSTGVLQVVPAVDVLGRDAVRLERGDFRRVLVRRDLARFVAALARSGPPMLHLVDLEAARDGARRPEVLDAVLAAAGTVPVEVAGGIRDPAAAAAALAQGAARVVVGTAACGDVGALEELVAAAGDRLVVAIDARGGRVAVEGWRDGASLTVAEVLERCLGCGVERVEGTAVARDGTLRGPDLELAATLCASGLAVAMAGGIRDAEDLADLAACGCEGAIIGRAILDGWQPWREREPARTSSVRP